MATVELDPWTDAIDEFPIAGSERDRLRAAVKYAVLAPSSHNSQPWIFRLGADHLDLLADRTRALPVVDPDDRELVISCGAALKLLRIALAHFGQEAEVTLPTHGDVDLLARVRIVGPHEATATEHRLFEAIRARHTNRLPFDLRPLPEPALIAARELACVEGARWAILPDLDDKETVAAFVAEADRLQMADPHFRRELAAWMHPNRSHTRDGMPGSALGLASLASHLGPLVIRTFDLGKGSAARDRELATDSPALAVLFTDHDATRDWINAGQALAAFSLRLAVDGISVSYLNQPLELPLLRLRLRDALSYGGTPQLLLRLGYGKSVKPTSRRPVEEVIHE